MDNKITSHIVKGSILSGIVILMSIIVSVFNLYEVSWVNYITYAVMIGGLIYSCILLFINVFAICISKNILPFSQKAGVAPPGV